MYNNQYILQKKLDFFKEKNLW